MRSDAAQAFVPSATSQERRLTHMNLTDHRITRQLKAVMFGLGLAASLLSPIASAQPVLLVDTGAGSSAGLPLFATGSTTCSPQPVSLRRPTAWARRLTLGRSSRVSTLFSPLEPTGWRSSQRMDRAFRRV